MKVCVSACLLGERCKYNGGDNLVEGLVERLEEAGSEVVAVCPEVLGGLSTPRPAAEIQGSRVVTREGAEVTRAFELGAERALAAIDAAGGCDIAILQPRSPSCGAGRIYDGTFSGRLIAGDGLFARALIGRGVPIIPADCWVKGSMPALPMFRNGERAGRVLSFRAEGADGDE